MHTSPRSSLVLFLLALTGAAPSPAGDWPDWRGPHRDGSVEAEELPAGRVQLELAWQRPIGSAYSAVSVVGERAVTMAADGDEDVLLALDVATGDTLWSLSIGPTYAGHDGSDDGPVGTPVIDGSEVFALGPHGRLVAARLEDGAELWQVDLVAAHGARAPFYGFTTVPLVVDDLVVVQAGGESGKSLVALDRGTGELRWATGDDEVHYQAPILATIAGQRQVIAVGHEHVAGLRPQDGQVLWHHAHGGEDGGDGSTQPLLLGDDRLLLAFQADTVLLRIGEGGVEELWRTTELKQSFATPVEHDGYLYGFSGAFLTCVDASSGERVWRSRPPGGQGLIRVGDHLVVFAPKGQLVVAAASPDGYQEEGRLGLGERGSYTWPSYAGGRVFVRNVEMIAAVTLRPGDGSAAAEETASYPFPESAFGKLLAEAAASDDPNMVVDAYLEAQESFPIIEGETLAHIVYRGEVDDIALNGSMTEFGGAEPMHRLAGTDLHYRTFVLEPEARWEYRFNVDFDQPTPDPRNPHRAPGADGSEMSELRMPRYSAPVHIAPPTGARGRLVEMEVASEALGRTQALQVYLPAGYDSSVAYYPLLVVNEGDAWIEQGRMVHTLDNEIGRTVAPLIVAFVDSPEPQARFRELGGGDTERYVRMLVDEIVPELDRRFRTVPRPEARALVGRIGAGVASVIAALHHPEVFGKVAVQSLYMPSPFAESILETLAAGTPPDLQLDVRWNRYELSSSEFGFDLGVDTRRLADALTAAGVRWQGGEAIDASGWGSWRAWTGDFLGHLFPARSATTE